MWIADYYQAETLNELCRKIGKDHFRKGYGAVEIKKATTVSMYGHEASVSGNAILEIQNAADTWCKFYGRMDLVSSVIEFLWKNQNIYKLEKKYNDMPDLAMLQYKVCTVRNFLAKRQAEMYEPKNPYNATFCVATTIAPYSTYLNIQA